MSAPISPIVAASLPSATVLRAVHWQLDNLLRAGLTIDEAGEREAVNLPAVLRGKAVAA